MSFLKRCLTQNKIDFADFLLDKVQEPKGKKFLVEINAIRGDNSIVFDKEKSEFKWHVHYYFVYDDGRRELRQEYHYGTYEYVRSLFSIDLLVTQ